MTCKKNTTLKNWTPQLCCNKTTSKCGGECLKFKCYLNNPSKIEIELLIGSEFFIDKQPIGQVYYKYTSEDGFIENVFLCRSAIKNKTVYVYGFDEDKNLVVEDTITIDNKCEYRVNLEVKIQA